MALMPYYYTSIKGLFFCHCEPQVFLNHFLVSQKSFRNYENLGSNLIIFFENDVHLPSNIRSQKTTTDIRYQIHHLKGPIRQKVLVDFVRQAIESNKNKAHKKILLCPIN